MSAPPEALKQLMASAGGGGTTGAPAPSAGMAPPGLPKGPVSSPMSTPEPASGNALKAMPKIAMALDLLEQAIPDVGSESEDGMVLVSCLQKLGQKFGHARNKGKEMVPAELKMLMASQNEQSPELKAMSGMGAGGPPPGAMKPPGLPAGVAPQA